MTTIKLPDVLFTAVKYSEGYDMAQVDALIDKVSETPQEEWKNLIQPALFAPTRFRAGYHQGEVDRYLDKLVEMGEEISAAKAKDENEKNQEIRALVNSVALDPNSTAREHRLARHLQTLLP